MPWNGFNTLILRRPRVDIFTDIIKTVTVFNKTIFKDSKRVWLSLGKVFILQVSSLQDGWQVLGRRGYLPPPTSPASPIREQPRKSPTWKELRQLPNYLARIYLFKVNNRNTRKKCEICSKLTIKILERRRHCCVFIVNFEHILHLFLVFSLLNLNK